jgi:hypothetical protein
MRRWEDNCTSELKVEWCEVVNWSKQTHGRDQWRAGLNTVMNLLNFLRSTLLHLVSEFLVFTFRAAYPTLLSFFNSFFLMMPFEAEGKVKVRR